MPFKKELVLPTMTRWTDKQKMTVDRKVKHSGLLIKSGITTIKFFPTARYAQSKSVAVAADSHANAHATTTHLLSHPARTSNKVFTLLTITLLLVSLTVSGQIPIIKEPQPFSFTQPDIVKMNTGTPSTNHALTNTLYSLDQNERNRQIMKEVDEHIKYQEQQKRLVAEAMRELDGPQIEYSFRPSGLKGKRNFYNSYDQITKMLTGESKASLKRAVFLSEFAYDTTMNYEKFNQEISEIVRIVGLKMKDEKISPTDNMGKIMTLFQFMADTIRVKEPLLEKTITTYPKTYDFEDFWGHNDLRKTFVSKLLKSGTGNCHSLPLLFLILAEEIGVEAHLAFAPNHSYVKFKDKMGNWQNIELTIGMIASNQFMVQTGYIKAEAIQNKIYLEAVSKEQAIAQCLNDLTMYYTRRYGYDDFVIKCTNTSINKFPVNLTAHQINANYYTTLADYVIQQYKHYGLTKSQFDKDEKAQYVLRQAIGARNHVENLGYSDMPADAYEAWIKSMEIEAKKQEQLNRVKFLRNMIQH